MQEQQQESQESKSTLKVALTPQNQAKVQRFVIQRKIQ
jgi:hypothetical protein